MNYENLAQEIHENNKAKGWWEKPRTLSTLLMLVVTEIAEATEAFRNHLPAICFMGPANYPVGREPNLTDFTLDGVLQKPEGEATEIVDAMIRILDISAGLEIDFAHRMEGMARVKDKFEDGLKAGLTNVDVHFEMTSIISNYDFSPSQKFAMFFVLCEEHFERNGWDLEKVMRLKLAYNKTRSHRHGGKAV